MNEIKNAGNDIDYNKLLFIGRNKEKLNFNIFSTPLNFLLDIFNGKITLSKAEINQRDLNEKIEELKYNYKPKNEKEKEEINEVLIHANDMLEQRDKIIEAFKDGTCLSEHLKKSDAAYDYVLKDVNSFIQKCESMSDNINPNLFNEFFELSPADYAKELINTKNPDKNKEFVAETKDGMSDLKGRIKKKKKKKNCETVKKKC